MNDEEKDGFNDAKKHIPKFCGSCNAEIMLDTDYPEEVILFYPVRKDPQFFHKSCYNKLKEVRDLEGEKIRRLRDDAALKKINKDPKTETTGMVSKRPEEINAQNCRRCTYHSQIYNDALIPSNPECSLMRIKHLCNKEDGEYNDGENLDNPDGSCKGYMEKDLGE